MAFVQQYISDKDCFGCGKKGHHIRDCTKLTAAEKKKIWNEKTTRWTLKGAPRAAAAKTGLNHLSTDEKAVEAVISIDARSTYHSSYAVGRLAFKTT